MAEWKLDISEFDKLEWASFLNAWTGCARARGLPYLLTRASSDKQSWRDMDVPARISYLKRWVDDHTSELSLSTLDLMLSHLDKGTPERALQYLLDNSDYYQRLSGRYTLDPEMVGFLFLLGEHPFKRRGLRVDNVLYFLGGDLTWGPNFYDYFFDQVQEWFRVGLDEYGLSSRRFPVMTSPVNGVPFSAYYLVSFAGSVPAYVSAVRDVLSHYGEAKRSNRFSISDLISPLGRYRLLTPRGHWVKLVSADNPDYIVFARVHTSWQNMQYLSRHYARVEKGWSSCNILEQYVFRKLSASFAYFPWFRFWAGCEPVAVRVFPDRLSGFVVKCGDDLSVAEQHALVAETAFWRLVFSSPLLKGSSVMRDLKTRWFFNFVPSFRAMHVVERNIPVQSVLESFGIRPGRVRDFVFGV